MLDVLSGSALAILESEEQQALTTPDQLLKRRVS